MESVGNMPSKKFWKIISILLVILVVIPLGFAVYHDKWWNLGSILKDTSTNLTCKATWGNYLVEKTCGSFCWNRYPITKSWRIERETWKKPRETCSFDSCWMNIKTCYCPTGKYFGSIVEWCIDNSESRNPE